MSIITDDLRQDRNALLDELRRAGTDVSRPSKIRCPFHDDRNPSAGVYQGQDDAWRFKCHGCGLNGDIFDIRASLSGRNVVDELKAAQADSGPQRRRASPRTPDTSTGNLGRVFVSLDELRRSDPRITDVYCYPDRKNVELVVLRLREPDGRKTFRQCRPVAGGFVYGDPPQPWPILNAGATKRADKVIVVEGEKDVASFTRLGFTATTSPGGAGKSHCADWSVLAGKTAYLWPDADDADPKTGQRTGIRHMREVAQRLQKLDPPARVMWIDPDKLGLSGGQDVTDLLAQHVDLDDTRKAALINDILAKAEPMGPSAGVRSIIEEAIAGRRRNIEFPWSETTRWACALLPGTVTLLVAPPGATKSFWLLQATAHWHDQDDRPSVLMLEDGREFHLRRALAQKAGIAEITDDEWCRTHPDEAQQAYKDHAAWLDLFGACIHELPGPSQPTFDAIGDWIETQAVAGRQIIAVDPLSIAADQAGPVCRGPGLHRAGQARRSSSLAVPSFASDASHAKYAKGCTLDAVAGGAAYTRLAHTVLWLEFHDCPKTVTVRDPLMELRFETEINRTLHVLKARKR